jgi:hypothetical protein
MSKDDGGYSQLCRLRRMSEVMRINVVLESAFTPTIPMSDPDEEVVAFKVMMEVTHDIYGTLSFNTKWKGQEKEQEFWDSQSVYIAVASNKEYSLNVPLLTEVRFYRSEQYMCAV